MTFPVNVPNVPGVPQVTFATGAVTQALSFLTSDSVSGYFGFSSQWGIFQGGAPIIVADSVVGMDYKQEWSLSDYPVEQGAFATYDKVALPFDVRVRFTAGSISSRDALLNSLAAVAGTTQLFDVVTPEVVYTSVTITHYDYRRTARSGLGLLQVDVWCLQVAPNGSSTAATTTAAPDDAAAAPGGAVQPGTPSTSQVTVASNGVATGPW